MAQPIPMTNAFRPLVFLLLINKTETTEKLGVCAHISPLQEGLFFFFFPKSEGFILIERQNYFCFAVNMTRSWKGYLSAPYVIHAPCSLEEEEESWVFRDSLFVLVPPYSMTFRSDPSS